MIPKFCRRTTEGSESETWQRLDDWRSMAGDAAEKLDLANAGADSRATALHVR